MQRAESPHQIYSMDADNSALRKQFPEDPERDARG